MEVDSFQLQNEKEQLELDLRLVDDDVSPISFRYPGFLATD